MRSSAGIQHLLKALGVDRVVLKGRRWEVHSDPLRLGNNDGLKWRVHRWKKYLGNVEHESPLYFI